MDIFKIHGPVKLSGTIRVNGSKNAALPIMAAALLAPGETILESVPVLSDINVLGELIESIGCKISHRRQRLDGRTRRCSGGQERLDGLRYMRNKEYQKAIDAWQKVLEKYPNNSNTLNNIEQARLRLGAQEPEN